VKRIYLLCAVAGAVIPFVPFLSWVGDQGFDPRLFLSDLLATRIGTFFGLDVLIAAVALIVFIIRDGNRLQVPNLWLPVAATCLVGVSCGLPLFLFMRERRAP
jgi:uncharacterized protein DUF2834